MKPPHGKRRRADPIFFLDRDLGSFIVANKLRGLGARIKLHDEIFAQTTADAVWLPKVGQRGWAILTKDAAILRRLPEVIALIQANTHVFVLKANAANGEQMARAFSTALPAMKELIRTKAPPLLARVTLTGNVEEIEGYRALQDRLVE